MRTTTTSDDPSTNYSECKSTFSFSRYRFFNPKEKRHEIWRAFGSLALAYGPTQKTRTIPLFSGAHRTDCPIGIDR